jgi:hypothetical protein
MIERLLHDDIYDLNRPKFMALQADEILMEALKCRFVEKFYPNTPENVALINELSFLFTQMDREIWLKIRKGKMTLRQIKTRVIERMDGYQRKYIEFDDIKDQLIPEL